MRFMYLFSARMHLFLLCAAFLSVSAGASDLAKRNILPNHEFDEPVPDKTWKIGDRQGQTLRQETAPMSREWIIRTTGKEYQFIRAFPPEFESDTEYTIEVRARCFGGDASLSVLEVYRRHGDGKVRGNGTYIAENIRLTPDFRTYYLPFRSTSDGKPLMVGFYKSSPREGDDRGIDVASIRMFKGKVEALSIRKIARTGRKVAVSPAVPVPPNPYGRGRDAMRALVFVKDVFSVREAQETFAGTGIEADVIVTTGTDQDIYLSECDQKDVESRLASGIYSVFCVTKGTGRSIGKLMAGKIASAVKSGAGIYATSDARKGRLSSLFEGAGVKSVGKDHPFVRMFPGNVAPDMAAFDPAKDLAKGKHGAGSVFVDLSPRPGCFKFMMKPALYGCTDFPFSAFADPALVWLLRHAAGRTSAGAGRVHWRSVDATGMTDVSGTSADEASALAAAKAAASVSGRHAVSMQCADAEGFTLGWSAAYFTKEGPAVSLEAIRASCDGDDPALFRAVVAGAGAGRFGVVWSLEDFSGRVLEHGETRPGERFEVPLRSLYTNMGVLRVALREGASTRAVARKNVFAKDRDFARLYDDFTVGVWGHRASCSRDAFVTIDRILEDIGVRWHCMPLEIGGKYLFDSNLANGMSTSGGNLGSSRCFVARRMDGSNIRSRFGTINTATARNAISIGARITGENGAPYGVVSYAVCDEPNLAERFTPDEPDEEPENVAEFRVRMEREYGTLAEYNRRHRTKHKAFSAIGPVRLADARATGNFSEYIEWRNFNVDRWCELIKRMAESGKSADPRLKLSLANSFGQTAASGNDYWKLLTKAGLDFSYEYTAMVSMRRDPLYNFDEFYRSFRPDMRVWGYIGYGMDGQEISFAPWWFAAHRYGGFIWFSTLGIGYNLLDSPSLALTQDAVDLKATLSDSRLMDGIGKLMLEYSWLPRQAAIYYSHDSLLLSTLLGKEKLSYEVCKTGPLHDYMHSRQGAQYLLEDLLYQHDFVAPEQVVAGALADRRILFLPCILALSDAEVAALKRFVRQGGRLVADRMPGDYDELGVRRKANPFTPGEVEVTGKNFDDLDMAQRKAMLARLEAADVKPVLASPGIENTFGREAMAFTDGTNLLYTVMRMPLRSSDKDEQTFRFARSGYVYDVRAKRYLGRSDRVSAVVPLAGASVWSVLPYNVESVRADMPGTVSRGTDIVADISVVTAGAACGTHLFHVDVVPPSGAGRFHLSRNVTAPGGRMRFAFRIAENDPEGEWTLKVCDVLTGMGMERRFRVEGGDAVRIGKQVKTMKEVLK